MNASRSLWLLIAVVEAIVIALLSWLIVQDNSAEAMSTALLPKATASPSPNLTEQPLTAQDPLPTAANTPTFAPEPAPDAFPADTLQLGTLVHGVVKIPANGATPNYTQLSLTAAGETKAKLSASLRGENLNFAWPDVAAGDYSLSVRADSMRDVTLPITIPEGATAHRVDVELEAKWLVKVLLKTPTGQSFHDTLTELLKANPSLRHVDWSDGVQVIALGHEIPAELPPTQLSATPITIATWKPANGNRRGPSTEQLAARYAGVLEIPERRACFTAVVLKEIVLARAPLEPEQTELELTIDPAQMFAQLATLRLKVVDPSGSPLPTAKIGVNDRQSYRQPTAVDADGQFEQSNLLPGSYKLSVRCKGYAIAPYTIALRSGVTTDIGTLTMQPTRELRIRPVGAADISKVRGSLVALGRSPHTSLKPSALRLTVRDGLLTTNIVDGRYHLRLNGNGGASIDFDARSLGDEPLEVTLQAETSITFDPANLTGPTQLIVQTADGLEVLNRWVTWRSKWQQAVMPGSYSVTVRNTQGEARTQQLAITANGANFTL
ncbi:MAG: hypothetical protein ACI8UD_002927 [Planctomycetota bacterium]|jgi:hypothetical protein